jgi:hypothetical protein
MRKFSFLIFLALSISSFLLGGIESDMLMGTTIVFEDGFESTDPLAGWQYPSPKLCKVKVSTDSHTGMQSVSLEDEIGLTWCLISKNISITPGTHNASVWVRTDGGKAFFWVEGLNAQAQVIWSSRVFAPIDHRLNPLVPDFVPVDYVHGTSDWQLLEINDIVATSDFTSLNLKFGSYFMPGRMYFDDILVDVAP